MSIRRLNISSRSAAGFGLIGLMVLALGLFALKQMAEMRKESNEVDQNWLPSIVSLSSLNAGMQRTRALTMRMVMLNSDEARAATAQMLGKLIDDVNQAKAEYEKLLTTADEKAAYERFKTTHALYMVEQRKVVELATQGAREKAMDVMNGSISQHADGMTKALLDLQRINGEEAGHAADRARAAYETAFSWVVITIIMAALVTVTLAVLFTRSIVRPLNQALQVAEAVAAGDLTRDVAIEGNDEPARLLVALKAMQTNLRNTVQGISDSSNQLASAAEELNTVTEDSTRGLHEQNHEIEQAATAVNEMTAAVDEVARNAVATSEASRESDVTAQQGRQQVIRTVESIDLLAGDVTTTATQVEQLAGQVRDISKVLDVIRSIAEQTNLLALNAAIEAARAGEQGRGFAVVADEVRNLAQKTAASTAEIQQIIQRLQNSANTVLTVMTANGDKSRESIQHSIEATQLLQAIAQTVSQIDELNSGIARHTQEQIGLSESIQKETEVLQQDAQATANGAEATARLGEQLVGTGDHLRQATAQFRV